MPHIRAIFIDDLTVREPLRFQKTLIRERFAFHSGYGLEQVAFIPERIPKDLLDLTDNLLPLEFVIDGGRKCAGRTVEISTKMKEDLLRIDEGFRRIKFGLWLRTVTDSNYIEHDPS